MSFNTNLLLNTMARACVTCWAFEVVEANPGCIERQKVPSSRGFHPPIDMMPGQTQTHVPPWQ